jgi:hypothetical protein
VTNDNKTQPGIRAFQLRILAGMRGNEGLVDQALRDLGACRADLNTNTKDLFSPKGGFENAIATLGPPLSQETTGRLARVTYELPLWPGLTFSLIGDPTAPMPHDVGFTRQQAQRPKALKPWTCLLDEVIEHVGPPIQEGDRWAPYEEYKFRHRTGGEFWAAFSWHLLQHTEWT